MGESEAGAVLEIAKRLNALTFDEFQLTSGETSPYYFDGRLVTLDPEGAYRVAKAFLPLLKDCGAQLIAGPAVAAVPIVSSVGVVSFTEGHPIPGLIVRQGAKRARCEEGDRGHPEAGGEGGGRGRYL